MRSRLQPPVHDRVLEVLGGEAYRHFMLIFEYTHRITGEVPLQPSNEIRLATNYLNTALRDGNETEASRNLHNAEAHVTSATILCYMISIINRIEFLSNFIEGLDTINVDVAPKFRNKLRTIRGLRDQIHPKLGQRSLDDQGREVADIEALMQTSNVLMMLLIECNTSYQELRDEFPQEQLIRGRAHALWKRGGCPNGQDRAHWLQAEAEVLGPLRR